MLGLLTISSARTGHAMDEQVVFDALRYRIEDDEDGTRRYYNGTGQLHRENGPAVEWADGTRYWYQNGQLHRTDGPAIEWNDGGKGWHQNDQLHRTDGPAIEWADGRKRWYINGEELSEEEFNRAVKAYV